MNRRERLMATLRNQPVDRPPVSFYDLDGLRQDPSDQSSFNIYNDPSWEGLLKLTCEKTDRISLCSVGFSDDANDEIKKLTTIEEHYDENGTQYKNIAIRAGSRTFTMRTRRDPDIDTVWNLEHILKDTDDLEAWLELIKSKPVGLPNIQPVLETEKKLGDSGIAMLDLGDPLCEIAELFEMSEYTIIALTEQELFHKALQTVFENKVKRVEAIASALPDRAWRIYGPEYACPPYLPPKLFREYVVQYDKPLIDIIKKYGGYPRIHAHGHIKDVLDDIVATGCTGLDPIEPPPQGNTTLAYVRRNYGDKLVLFGNLELSDIEALKTSDLEKKVITALEEGTAGTGGGFVLMPSAMPIGRKLSGRTYANYQKIIEVVEKFAQ